MKTIITIICFLLFGCSHIEIPRPIVIGGQITAGFILSQAIHEIGHYTMAKVKGMDIDFHRDGTWTVEEHDTLLKMSGLIAQGLTSEALLLAGKHEGYFWKALILTNAINELVYPTLRGNERDFRNLDPDEKRRYQRVFIMHGLITLFRVYGKWERDVIAKTGFVPQPFYRIQREHGDHVLGMEWRW